MHYGKTENYPRTGSGESGKNASSCSSNTKSSNLKTVPHTTKREICASGHIILSPVAQLLKALHRWQRFWPKPSFTPLRKSIRLDGSQGSAHGGHQRAQQKWVWGWLTIALYHFHATRIKRSAGQSAVAAAAYRSGEKLHSEHYSEDSDYAKRAA